MGAQPKVRPRAVERAVRCAAEGEGSGGASRTRRGDAPKGRGGGSPPFPPLLLMQQEGGTGAPRL